MAGRKSSKSTGERLRSAQAILSARRRAAHTRATPARSPGINTPSSLKCFTKSRMTGDLPPFNDWSSTIIDHQNRKLYLFGGSRPADHSNSPTSDFYCCDMQTMRWKNLSHSLWLLRPTDPFSPRPSTQPLPALHNPACAFLSLNERNFMFIFGGRNTIDTSSELIAVDLDNLTWWTVELIGGPVIGRMFSAMVGIRNRLYIFGGVTMFDAPPLASFSVAEYSLDDGCWKWAVRDESYPSQLPNLGYDGAATPVYGGKKILLTMGRIRNETGNWPMTLSKDTTILFHTTHHTFQVQTETSGEFPKNVNWYNLNTLPSSYIPLDLSLPLPPSSPGRPRKPLSTSTTQAVNPNASEGTNFDPISPSAIICAWIPHSEGYLVPELWQYLLPPEEECRCLDLRDKIWDLDIDLQAFVVVDRRSFFMGYECPPDTQVQVDEDPDAVWNVCVEVSLGAS